MVRLLLKRWITPLLMLAALIAGVLLAAGHHLFYSRLNGTPSSGSILLASISYQEANIAIGTALAIMVNSCLEFAVAAAFIQMFWKVLNEMSSTTMKQLDSIYSAPHDIFMLLKVWLWWKYPLLFALATLAWIITIASIITPATLSIHTAPVDPPLILPKTVPSLDFSTLDFVNYMPLDVDYPKAATFFYTGPSTAVLTVTNSAMSQGAILPIPPPAQNASWTLDFLGPSLKCKEVDHETKFRFLANAIEAYNAKNLSQSASLYLPLYVSWIPTYFWPPASNLPFPYVEINGTSNGTISPNVITSTQVKDDWSELTLYLMTIPKTQKLLDWPNPSNVSMTIENAKELYTGTCLSCKLYNSTYRVAFDYREGSQNVSIEVPHEDATSQSAPIKSITGPEIINPLRNSTSRVYHYENPEICLGAVDPPPQNRCGRINRTVVRSLSYQAVFDAFSRNIQGLIDDVFDSSDTSIKDMALVDNKQLRFLREQGSMWGPSLQEAVSVFNNTDLLGLSNSKEYHSEQLLARAIEETFRNVTVSFMSSPSLQPNFTSSTGRTQVEVTFHHYHNIYTYSVENLWLAYGIAILLTVIAVVIGFSAIASNGASYSDNISTILRASRGAKIGIKLESHDIDWSDPVPWDLENATVRFQRRQT